MELCAAESHLQTIRHLAAEASTQDVLNTTKEIRNLIGEGVKASQCESMTISKFYPSPCCSGDILTKKKAHREALREKTARELVRNELSTRLSKGLAPKKAELEANVADCLQREEALKSIIAERQNRYALKLEQHIES